MKPFLCLFSGFITCAFIIMGGLAVTSLGQLRYLPNQETIFIKKGMTQVAIAQLLMEKNIIPNNHLFLVYQKVKGLSIKAGEYAFKGSYSPITVSHLLSIGKTVHHSITIPEGLTTVAVMACLAQQPLLKKVSENISLPSSEYTEGCLLPETYDYVWGDTYHTLMQRMKTAQQDFLEIHKNDVLPLPLTSLKQVIILASIVEKETALIGELPLVAGVFLNRLKIGMPLQADSTVLYGLGISKREPTRLELKIDTPYNTYTHAGLPHGPICNPGKKALEAVLNPHVTEALYFVANGQGGHTFSKTLKEHRHHHNLWRDLRKAKP